MQSLHLEGAHWWGEMRQAKDLACFQQGCVTFGSEHASQLTLDKDISIGLAKRENSEEIQNVLGIFNHKTRRCPGEDGGKYTVLMEKILRFTT